MGFRAWRQRCFERRIQPPFAFLESNYGFCRVTSPVELGRSPLVRYENETTWVELYKDPWGPELLVTIGARNPSLTPGVPVIPLWAILQLRSPDYRPADRPVSIKEHIQGNARGMSRFAADLLVGDFSVSARVRDILAANAARSRCFGSGKSPAA